jgi:hypothetical protein
MAAQSKKTEIDPATGVCPRKGRRQKSAATNFCKFRKSEEIRRRLIPWNHRAARRVMAGIHLSEPSGECPNRGSKSNRSTSASGSSAPIIHQPARARRVTTPAASHDPFANASHRDLIAHHALTVGADKCRTAITFRMISYT